ncbi:ABC-type polar amino acid transport system ATPase subunit [Paenibacillus sp. RC254]|uniref:amino acid ABC transporter ATP-binding protein n=1 Tax=unclassified Paenibacillus TaxID=185978 RepID=UPI0024B9DBB6|nr:amino acid ABC transporter ATP-binding protein [Paenibacillus sp. RC334]
MIRVRSLHKQFHKHQVLKGIDLDVGEGQVVAIIGPSGSGKSTILRCINYLEKPEDGIIELDGRVIDARQAKKNDILYLRQHTTMVFQQFNLFKHKTALANVMLGLTEVQKKSKAEARKIADHYLDKVGLSNRKSYYPRHLSGGQQQRVAIARALALNPKVILLDEPTSALDPEMVNDVLEVIRTAAREGRTMIIVSHEMNFVYEIADKVIFMDNGQIVEQGTPQDIYLSPRQERTRQFLSKVNIGSNYSI